MAASDTIDIAISAIRVCIYLIYDLPVQRSMFRSLSSQIKPVKVHKLPKQECSNDVYRVTNNAITDVSAGYHHISTISRDTYTMKPVNWTIKAVKQ